MRKFTVTFELKDGTEYKAAVLAKTASHAKEIVRRRGLVEIQFAKESRPFNRDTDNSLPRIGW